MWQTFARLVRTSQAAGQTPDASWGTVAMKTQAVMDACMASVAKDGASVLVLEV
jgi:hypothetical protein